MRYNPVMGKDAALVERLLDAFARKDADALAGMIAEDFLFEPLSTEAADRGAYRGGEGMRTYLRDLGDTWRQFDVSIGSVQEVLIDAGPETPGGPFRGRTAWQAPDIDGSVLVRTRRDLPIGEFLKVEVTGAEPYDLLARPVPARRKAPAIHA